MGSDPQGRRKTCDHSLCGLAYVQPRTWFPPEQNPLLLPPSFPSSLLCPPFPLAILFQASLLRSGPLGPVIIRKRRKEGSQPSPSGLQKELGLHAGDPGLQRFQYLFFFSHHRTCQHTGPDTKHQGGAKAGSSWLSFINTYFINCQFSRGTNSQGNPLLLPPLSTFILWPLHSTIQEGNGRSRWLAASHIIPSCTKHQSEHSRACSSSAPWAEQPRAGDGCRPSQLLLYCTLAPALAFSWAMLRGSLICLLAIFLPSPGDDVGL